MKPPGKLKHIPTAVEERLGAVTILFGIAGTLSGLFGLAWLIVQLGSPGTRFQTLREAIPGYLAWEFSRFSLQMLLGVLAVAVGRGLRSGEPSARKLAGRYGLSAIVLGVAVVVFEIGWVAPALGDRAANSHDSMRLAQFIASDIFAVQALLLLVFLRESESGPLVWELNVRTPEGGIFVMPADVPRTSTAAPTTPRISDHWRHFFVSRLALPAAGLLLVGAVVWSSVSLWKRPEFQSSAPPEPVSEPAPSAPTKSPSPAPPLPASPTGPGFPQPADALRAFDALGSGRVIALGYTADGGTLVTVGRNGVVRLWGSKGGPPSVELTVSEPSPDGIAGGAVSADGRALAVATSQGPPRVFDLPVLRERPPLPDTPGRGHPRAVSFAADGRLAATDDTGFRIWGPDGHLRLASPALSAGRHVALASNRSLLAEGGDVVHLYDAETGQERHVLHWGGGYLTGLEFSPDGKIVAASSSSGMVTLWDTATGQQVRQLRHAGTVTAFAFTPDGRRLIAGTDSTTLHTWHVADGRAVGTQVVFPLMVGAPPPWYGGIRAIAFRPDGAEFAVACGGAVAIFPIDALPPG